jgi:hypothetical protein
MSPLCRILTMACRKIFNNNSVYTLFVQNKIILYLKRKRVKQQISRSLDLRGTPTHACLCGSLLFSVKCMFEDSEISLYFTDAECVLCGALVTVPTPVDEDYAQI